MEQHRHICKDIEQLSIQAAEYVLSCANRAVAHHDAFYFVLAGGSTPKKLYQTLTQAPYLHSMPWAQTHIFLGDERSVDWQNHDSNARMVKLALLDHVPVNPNHVHLMQGELSGIRRAAHAYELRIRQTVPMVQQLPQFDLVLLGMGDDGHTASLFPGTHLLHDHEHLVGVNYVPQLNTWRMSMTYTLLNHAACVAILTSGSNKAARIAEIFSNAPPRYPIQNIKAQQELVWFLDQASAELLPQ